MRSKKEINAYCNAWRKKNPEKVKATSARFYKKHKDKILAYSKKWHKANPRYLRRYNVTVEWYEKNTKRGCATCGSKKNLVIDHKHTCCADRCSCGKCVRGILCKKCNMALGLLQENPKILKNLIRYLRKYERTT